MSLERSVFCLDFGRLGMLHTCVQSTQNTRYSLLELIGLGLGQAAGQAAGQAGKQVRPGSILRRPLDHL